MQVLFYIRTESPRYADIDPKTYNLDPNVIEDKITEKTKTIIAVHLYGHPADMDPIMEIAQKHNLVVIEDTAQATGATYKRRKGGSIGHIGCFSIGDEKNLIGGRRVDRPIYLEKKGTET